MPEQKPSKGVARSLLARTGLAAALLLAAPVLHGQRRLGPPAAARASGLGTPALAFHSRGVVRQARLVPRLGQPAPRRARGNPFRGHRHGGRRVFECTGGTTGQSVQQILAPYPGYGFDFEHLNAIHSDLGMKAAIDPATQLELRELENWGCREAPSLGYLLLDDDYARADETAEEGEQTREPTTEPQIIIVEEQPPAAQTPRQASTPTSEAPAVRDEGQFELVLANRTVLEAVAFTRARDQIIYITPEGARQAVALSSVDIAATIRVNEEHGTPIELSF